MTSRKFAPLFWTQFLTAFNDNFLKNTLVFVILFKMSASEGAALVTLAGVILIVPFLLLSALGGELADKHDKAKIAELLKRCEIAVAALAVIGLAFSSIFVLMAALFGFGIVSALFGPIKYGILPDHLERRDLPKANAWIEGGTFIAILAGTIIAAFAFSGGDNVLIFGTMMMGLSVLCWLASRMIPPGVMLPNANGAAATLLGVMSAGKVPAMLNFTAGAANILSACKAAQVKHVLTSRAFVTQAKLGPVIAEMEKQVTIVWLDDLRAEISLKDKILGLLRKARPLVKRQPDDPAVILFTSGSEGTPKGVVLTHRNILSNAAQAAARIDFHSGDKVFNILPVFHSFGLTAGTVLPLISGVPVYFYPSPLHYRIVPELIYASNATIIFGTDTFLNGYSRTAHPYDFRSIRYIFSGAEPVKAATRQTYMEKFGLRILEGYGVTETAPVISINTPMYNKSGTVGKILPGMEWKLEPVPGIDEGGRLHVRGANVMAGYLRAEKPGVLEPLVDGWHDTGDIVTIDEDGFVKIRGRAKRFAKIAGEMISLAAVETLAAELWPGALSVVSSLPDAKKGERLVLLTDAPTATRAEFLAFAKSKGAMDMMVPAEVNIGKVPVLGSGKVDFVAARKLAESAVQAGEAA
ncbi:AMP-binding protein [Rhizobium acaciae]|uniref:AMP-binding protein n=1 Tax=Rhizobium acaciae TaxID=2989736 RepID=UPI003873A668